MHDLQVQLDWVLQHTAVIGSVCVGLCVCMLARFVMLIIYADRHDASLDYIELRRRKKIRESNTMYRYFEPAIDNLAKGSCFAPSSAAQKEKAASFTACTKSLGDFAPWHLEEYSATSLITGLGLGIVAAIVVTYTVGLLAGVGAFAIVPFLYVQGTVGNVRDRAKRRTAQIKRRLPFAVDLMALVMESGSSFLQALRTLVAESRDHPLGEELGLVLKRIDHGELASVALEDFQLRIGDDDLRQLVDAINQGEKLGTPLSLILRKQADLIRMKTSQWVERAAKEAEVRITGPGFVMAIACMIIVAAPFVLKAVSIGF